MVLSFSAGLTRKIQWRIFTKLDLVEKLGELLQQDFEMKKEKVHDELLKIGRKRPTSRVMGFLLGFLLCLLLLVLKIM